MGIEAVRAVGIAAGQMVGRGGSVLLRKEVTATPGRKRLEVVAERDGSLVSLRGWDLDIQAPPLGFAGLEPPARSLERSPGARVSFRAPVNVSEGEKLAFLWEVNGQPARGADGPTYDFQPQGPGEYVVQVRATAPWGASIANTWTLLVRPPIPPPELRQEAARPDPRADAQAWIQMYCTAFEKKAMAAYDIPGGPADYELDHLVSLDLGGSNDAGNLWPERNDHPAGATNSKDRVEAALNRAVCARTVTLAAAQKAIATDWTTALATLKLPALT